MTIHSEEMFCCHPSQGLCWRPLNLLNFTSGSFFRRKHESVYDNDLLVFVKFVQLPVIVDGILANFRKTCPDLAMTFGSCRDLLI